MWQLFCDHLSSTFYRRPYYRIASEIFGEHRSARRRRLYALDCAIFLYAHRVLWIAYVVHNDFKPVIGDEDIEDTKNITQWNDLVLGFVFANSETYDAFIFVGIYLFAAFYWYCQTAIWQLDSRSIWWQSWYELVVESQDAYRAAMLPSEVIAERRRQLELWYSKTPLGAMLPGVAKGIYCSIAARMRMWWKLSNVDQRQLFAPKQNAILSNISRRIRRRSILFLVAVDNVVSILQAIPTIVGCVVVIGFALFENTANYTPLAIIWIIAEIYFTHYAAQRLIRFALFSICCSKLATIVLARHLIEIYDRVRVCISLCRRNHLLPKAERVPKNWGLRSGPSRMRATQIRIPLLVRGQCGPLIDMLLVEHNKSVYYMLKSSEQLFGRMLFAFLLTNLPINVYIVQRITFEILTSLDYVAMSSICFLQLLSAFMTIWTMARRCAIFNLPTRFIPALQAIMRTARWLPCKLKYDDLYGRLVSGPKIGISIGPMEAVTYNTAFEFIFIYAAFIMMAFSRKITANLQRAGISQ